MGTQKRAKAEMLSEIFFFSTQECIFSGNPAEEKGRKTRLEMERISYRRSARRPFQQRWLTKPYGAPNEQASSDESGHQGQKTIFHHYSLNRLFFLPKKVPIFVYLLERTLIWAHAYLSARLFERTLIWAHAYLSTRLFQRTLISAHAYFSARLYEQMPFTNTRANF